MKKLITIPYRFGLFCLFIIASSIGFLIYILNLKVESTIKTKLHVNGFSDKYLILKSDDAYLLKLNSLITLRINHQYYYCSIKSIKYDEKNSDFLMEIKDLKLDLIPDSNLEATVIYDEHKIIDSLVGYN